MKKIFLAFAILALASQSCFALYHDFIIGENRKELAYFIMPMSGGGTMGSALNYDMGLSGSRGLEISLFSARTATLLPSNSSVQLQVLGKQKLWELGPIGITGVLGAGMVYSPSLGSVFSPNAGVILGTNISPELKIGAPMIISFYSDPAVLIDFSLGISYSPSSLPGKSILLGLKNTLMGLFATNQMAFNNTIYGSLGFRAEL